MTWLAVRWSDTFTLGSAVAIAVMLGLGGLFTLRSRLGSYWKQAYEEQLARAERERELKHDLKSELAAEKLKTDLSAMMEQNARQHIELIQELSTSRDDAMRIVSRQLEQMEARLSKQHQALIDGQAANTEVLHKLADKIAEKVGEKISKKLNGERE